MNSLLELLWPASFALCHKFQSLQSLYNQVGRSWYCVVRRADSDGEPSILDVRADAGGGAELSLTFR